MKFCIKPLLLSTLLLCSVACLAADPMIQSTIQKYMQENEISGAAVLLYKEGKMQSYYFGEAVPEKHIPVTENTIFELGSITKTFTGLLLAQNVIENNVSLQDSVTHYLNLKTSRSFQKITLLDLATYTAGLPFNAPALPYNAVDSNRNSKVMQRFLKHWKAPYQPGSKILYSNFGYGLLGTALANSQTLPLPLLMQQTILNPLGMQNSGLDLKEATQENLAQGFTGEGTPIKHRSSGLLSGAWAMKASVADMQAYLKAALMLPEIPPEITQAMKISQTAYCDLPDKWSVGLAWKIIPLDKPKTIDTLINRPHNQSSVNSPVVSIANNPKFYSNAVIEKTGATDGFRAYIAVIPKTQTGIVVLINRFTYSAADFTNIAHSILLEASGMI
jgi:beta-lactamase class C